MGAPSEVSPKQLRELHIRAVAPDTGITNITANQENAHAARKLYLSAVVLTVATALGAAQYGWWRYMTIADPSGDGHRHRPQDQLQEQQRRFLFFLGAGKRSGRTRLLDRLQIVAAGRSTPDIVFVTRSDPKYGGRRICAFFERDDCDIARLGTRFHRGRRGVRLSRSAKTQKVKLSCPLRSSRGPAVQSRTRAGMRSDPSTPDTIARPPHLEREFKPPSPRSPSPLRRSARACGARRPR